MSKEHHQPSIRFNDFNGNWEKKCIQDLVIIGNGQDYKHLSLGSIPVYGTGGYMGSVGEALSYHRDAIGIGRKGTIDKPFILKAPFWTVDTLFYAIPNNPEYLNFVFDIFQNIPWKRKNESTGVPSLTKDAIYQTKIYVPTKEQEGIKIGILLDLVDQLIVAQQEKHEKLIQAKLAFLGDLLIHNNTSLPHQRFSCFETAWEKMPLSSIVSPYTDYLPTPTDGYTRLGIRSHMKGTFYEYVAPSKQLGEKRLQRVRRDNFIVNIVFAWEHAIAVTTEEDEGKLVSHRFPQFSFNEGMYPRFFHYALNDERFRHHLWLASPSGAGRNKTLRIDEMLEYELRVPEYDEQKKIADFLTSLDKLIELYEYRITKLQNIKAACLQGMFVQEDNT